jgi:hypothetical protein
LCTVLLKIVNQITQSAKHISVGCPWTSEPEDIKAAPSCYRFVCRVFSYDLCHHQARLPKPHKKRVRRTAAHKVHPSKPEARDEGPRLIPLDNKQSDKTSRLEYYLRLADAALKPAPDKAKTKTVSE